MRLFGIKILVESGIRDGFLNSCNFLCIFVGGRGRVMVFLMHVSSTSGVRVRVRVF